MQHESRAKEKIGAAMADGLAPDAPNLPAPDCPVLIGVEQIAAWLNISRGRTRGMIADGSLPTWRWPGRSVRCALKSAIGAAVQEHANRPRACAKAPRKKLPEKS
jgi:excisionase family DNA binding protein